MCGQLFSFVKHPVNAMRVSGRESGMFLRQPAATYAGALLTIFCQH